MNAWTRVNLVLALLAAVLLAVLWWPGTQPGSQALTGLAPDVIGRVRIERNDQLAIELVRDGDGWRLAFPREVPAQTRRVEQLLAVARAPVQRSYPAGDDLAQYGLERPATVLQLDAVRLAFGDRDPTQQLRYVHAGDRVLVIDDLYFNLLTLPPRHFAGD